MHEAGDDMIYWLEFMVATALAKSNGMSFITEATSGRRKLQMLRDLTKGNDYATCGQVAEERMRW